jgi:hypothetical protein
VTSGKTQQTPRTWFFAAAVFVVGFAGLIWNIEGSGVAAPWSDPIAQVRAQDESVYINSALTMNRDGDWMTPRLTGRIFPQKPPLLMWMCVLAIRIFGLSLFAVRLPAIALGAAGASAVFVWTARARSLPAGLLAAGLLLLSPLWQAFSRLCYTDVLCSGLAALALMCVALDPQLEHRRTRILCGALGGAAILAKSVAGILPFAALLLYWLLIDRPQRPRFSRVGEVALWGAVAAAPWHVYEACAYPQWFWADYVQFELLGIGLHPQSQGTFDRSVFRYAARVASIDAVLALLAIAGVTGAMRFRGIRRQAPALLALSWTLAAVVAIGAVQTRSLPYVVLLAPSLCVLGVVCSPRFFDRPAIVGVVLVAVALLRVTAGREPWSLRWTAPPLEGARAMRAYYDLHRDTELVSVNTDDQFYSMTIPLPRVRYCFLDPTGFLPRFAPSYAFLGIVLTVQQFVALPQLEPRYRARLRAWGEDSSGPIGTTILISDPGDLALLLRARPADYFYLPSAWVGAAGSSEATHQLVRYSATRAFLLRRNARMRPQPIPRLPSPW